MLKTVGSSGQISLGKRFAGQHFSVEFAESGAVTLRPVKIVAQQPAATARKPKFQIVKVKKVLALSREELHERGSVR